MDNTKEIIVSLMSLIDDKGQLFDEIMKITLQQKKDIEENEAKDIEQLVNRKQAVIDSIDKIDKSFSDKLNLLKKQLNVDSLEQVDYIKYPELKELKYKVEEIMSLAQKITQIEGANKTKLISIMNNLRKEMKQLSVGKKSIKAYESPIINNDGIYIDKKK